MFAIQWTRHSNPLPTAVCGFIHFQFLIHVYIAKTGDFGIKRSTFACDRILMASWVRSTSIHPTSITLSLILSCNQCLVFPSSSFLHAFWLKFCIVSVNSCCSFVTPTSHKVYHHFANYCFSEPIHIAGGCSAFFRSNPYCKLSTYTFGLPHWIIELCKGVDHDKWVPLTMAWRILGLQMKERPPDMEGNCKYIQ